MIYCDNTHRRWLLGPVLGGEVGGEGEEDGEAAQQRRHQPEVAAAVEAGHRVQAGHRRPGVTGGGWGEAEYFRLWSCCIKREGLIRLWSTYLFYLHVCLSMVFRIGPLFIQSKGFPHRMTWI